VLAAADPGNPFGAALAWPRRGDDDRRVLARAAGAYVALVDGAPVVYLDRGGSSLQLLPAADDLEVAGPALRGLAHLVGPDRPFRELLVSRVDGVPVTESSARERLLEAGFTAGYRGLVLRHSPGAPSSDAGWAPDWGRGTAPAARDRRATR
jgi:ATP-dependent helicase Lhr and Lhr-like helicase